MPLSDSTPPAPTPRCGPLRWGWLPHAHGQPAEPLARAWLAAELATPIDTLPLTRDARQRPQLGAPFAAFDCNWSHSGEGLLVALGEDVLVGVDSERRHVRPRALELARRYFTARELAWLTALTDDARDLAFLRLWCAKEAVLKAHGHGISFGLQRLEFSERDGCLQLVACDPALGAAADWSLCEFEPTPEYLATLAWRALP